MPLDTQLPEWISRSWAPRETFDPTPWLQERYRRQVQAQVLPLEIQGMALKNQAEQLHIEQQAMQNEQAGMEMQDYKTQLPVFQEAYKATGGNVKALLDSPVPAGVTHPKLVQMWLNAQHSAANTTLGQSYMQDQIELTKSANALVQAGGDPMPAYIEGPNGPEGPHRIDREALANQWKAIGAEKEAAALRMIYARQEHYYDENGNLVYGQGVRGYAPEVTEKEMLALDNQRELVRQAHESGNPDSIAHEEQKLADLQRFQAQRQRPSTTLTMLQRRLTAATSAYYSQGMPPNLKTEIERLEKEIQAESNLTGQPVAPGAPATNIIDPLGIRPLIK